jgi:hypothetical protein
MINATGRRTLTISERQSIDFIGFCNAGAPMAANLVCAGSAEQTAQCPDWPFPFIDGPRCLRCELDRTRARNIGTSTASGRSRKTRWHSQAG